MSGEIIVKEFKHIPGVNDAEYIKKLEELHEIDKGIINKAVAKIKMLSAQLTVESEQRWIPVTEESVIQAGYEGREVRFRIRGRLFAIRELAQ